MQRFFDLLLSSVAIIFLLPLLIPVMVILRLTGEGEVFFRQARVGKDKVSFSLLKFATMLKNSEQLGAGTVTLKDDFRVLPVGAFLRKTSLDELPQFINVIQGQMSIVGPRPHAVAHNEQYRQIIGDYMLRHKVKPGITGWAQINGWRGETDTLEKMEKRVEFDLYYIRNWSLYLDVKIVFLTIFRGFNDSNAY